ncbi:MAG: IPT/TIG domain-containing protein [Fimbriimonadaceae bacterium]|nr:IPT/TIG domain-containing protein [Fimbriimonadaceae bacterium]
MRLTALTCLLALTGLASAANLDSLNRSHAHGSARLAMSGTGFGSGGANSWVSIGGTPAILSSWSDTRIVAYVPEGMPLGATEVRVLVAGSPTNPLPLKIGPRVRSGGRVPWRFELDDDYLTAPPYVGPDGTVYAKGIHGHTYAIAADGGLKWLYLDGLTDMGQVSVTMNGDILIGGANNVARLNPQGQPVWWAGGLGVQFLCGPNEGPDGKIYGASNEFYGGIGAFEISASGQLLRTHPMHGRSTGSSYTYPVAFTAEGWHVYDARPRFGGGTQTVYAFHYGGGLRWSRSGQVPLALPGGRIYVQVAGGENNYGAYDSDGSLAWAHSYNNFGVPGFHPTVGPDGSVYQVTGGSWLVRFGLDGQVVWIRKYPFTTLQHGCVTPDGAIVVFNQTFNLTDPRRVRAIDQAGNALWQVDLPFEGGQAVAPFQPFGLSPDSRRAYLGTTSVSPSGDPRAYLCAFDLQAGGPISFSK